MGCHLFWSTIADQDGDGLPDSIDPDIDGDGDIDIVVANGRHWPEFNQIFFNDGTGFFRKSKLLGTEATTSYMVPLADIDNDGDLDIIVANDRIKNQVFKNDGKGNFTFNGSFTSNSFTFFTSSKS